MPIKESDCEPEESQAGKSENAKARGKDSKKLFFGKKKSYVKVKSKVIVGGMVVCTCCPCPIPMSICFSPSDTTCMRPMSLDSFHIYTSNKVMM